MATQSEKLQAITTKYREAGEPWPATTQQLAVWALNKGHWNPHREAVVRIVADEFARALREEFTTDPQGRTVRAKHAARVKGPDGQQSLWDDMRTADRDFMNVAFKQRRQAIVGDCRQLNTDVTSFNENWNSGARIQLSLDFTADVAELEAAEAAAKARSQSSSINQPPPVAISRSAVQESA